MDVKSADSLEADVQGGANHTPGWSLAPELKRLLSTIASY